MLINGYISPPPLMSPEITDSLEQRFWNLVDKSPGQGPNSDCWIWRGALSKQNGYPIGLHTGGKTYRASHLALAVDGRPRPSGEKQALHSCDHKPCVRPSHLRWGTTEENHQDYRERREFGPRCLHPDTVRAIRAESGRTIDIARKYGVTASCIHQIRKRVTHKHVD